MAGFEALRRATARPPRWRSAIVTVALIAGGGTWLFDVVNPRVLSASSLSVMFRSRSAQFG